MKFCFRLCSVAGLLLFSAATAAAHPIAPAGTEGLTILVDGSPVIANYQGNTASYSNDLYLALDATGLPGNDGILTNDRFIFNNQTSVVGSTVNLGNFALGTELLFRLHVNNTGYDYYTGAATRNPDGRAHARVQRDFIPGETLVSFEDLFGTPEGALGYNDLSFSFSNTTSSAPLVPEPASVVLFGTALTALAMRRRSR